MDGYEVKVYWSPDDECYVAQIEEFVGCAVDGETADEALSNLHKAKEAWIRDMKTQGHSIPLPRHRTVHQPAEPASVLA